MGLGPQDDRRVRSPGRRGDLIAGKETYGGGGQVGRGTPPAGLFDRAAPQAPPSPAEGPQRTPHGKRVPHGTERARRATGRQAGEPEAAAKPRRQTGELGHARKAAVVKPAPATGTQRPQAVAELGPPEKRPSSNRCHRSVREDRRQPPNPAAPAKRQPPTRTNDPRRRCFGSRIRPPRPPGRRF